MTYAGGGRLGLVAPSSSSTPDPVVTLEPGDEFPTVHLGLTYTGDELEPEPPVPLAAGVPLWLVLLGATYWLANRFGSRI